MIVIMTDEKKKKISDSHRAAMSKGVTQRNAIQAYLETLQSPPPRLRTRKGRSVADLQRAISESTDPMERLYLRPLLRRALEVESGSANMDEITANFVKHVVAFSERNGITYADWREEGVPAAVLREAGMRR
jgi:hypothetical protein